MFFRPSNSNTTTLQRSPWMLRLTTAAIWLLAALFSAYWAMKFVKSKSVSASTVLIVPQASVDSLAIGKFLGADPTAVKAVSTESSANLALFGVASAVSGHGVALISTDGKPAKPYRVGSKVTDTLTLKSVARTEVKLSSANSEAELVTLAIQVRQGATGTNPLMNTPASFMPNAPRFPLQQLNPPGAPALVPSMPPNMPPDASGAAMQSMANAVTTTTTGAISKFAPRETNSISNRANVGLSADGKLLPSAEQLPGVVQAPLQ